MKRIVSIQDISCFGKCSSTVALPVLSALGIETVILPTALLSTHTGEFSDYSFLSLTDEMKKIIEHWKKEKIEFDAIYVGYIGSIEQIDIICDFIKSFSNKNTIVYVDPAMADNAKLYSGLNHKYVEATKHLCSLADIISPNIYEAMLLCDIPCHSSYTDTDVELIARKLSEFSSKVIITGVHSDKDILTCGYDKLSDTYFTKKNTKIDGMFYGTGDVFAGAFIGTYMHSLTFSEAISFSDDFVQNCIEKTLPDTKKYWYGINFEKCLNILTEFHKTHSNNNI